MEGPTYVTLSAQVALQKQLEVVANNIANASTNGYKADRQLFMTYVNRLAVPGNSIAFVQDRATYIDRSAGQIQATGNSLDIAVKGDAYLGVTTPQGTQYTRNGAMQVGQDGTLTDASGQPIQDTSGQPIQLPQGYTNVRIDGDGTLSVTVNNIPQQIGQIGLFRSDEPLALRKSGSGLLVNPSGSMQPVDSSDTEARIVQGALEGSTVHPVTEIANLTELSRAYDRLQTLLSDDNSREQKMIQILGQTT